MKGGGERDGGALEADVGSRAAGVSRPAGGHFKADYEGPTQKLRASRGGLWVLRTLPPPVGGPRPDAPGSVVYSRIRRLGPEPRSKDMGRHSAIEWTHHTFNPWWGCTKVSPACNHCYAESWSRRIGLDVWGSRARRRFFGESHWREPLRWNRTAAKTHSRKRVFCASMADVFEQRDDLSAARARLWELIEQTPSLDWLLLTKRPENVSAMVPWGAAWPANVWLGATVEDQEHAALRVPPLLKAPARVHFLSCEPLLSPLDLSEWMVGPSRIVWVIAGGESGGQARPTQPEWFRGLRDQCQQHGVLLHFKQWGEWGPDLGGTLRRKGKKAAGRELDGRAWDEVPVPIT